MLIAYRGRRYAHSHCAAGCGLRNCAGFQQFKSAVGQDWRGGGVGGRIATTTGAAEWQGAVPVVSGSASRPVGGFGLVEGGSVSVPRGLPLRQGSARITTAQRTFSPDAFGLIFCLAAHDGQSPCTLPSHSRALWQHAGLARVFRAATVGRTWAGGSMPRASAHANFSSSVKQQQSPCQHSSALPQPQTWPWHGYVAAAPFAARVRAKGTGNPKAQAN